MAHKTPLFRRVSYNAFYSENGGPDLGRYSMSNKNRNLMVAYISLVGVPIAALLAVLDTGQRLHAPVAIAGNWEVHTDRPFESSGCDPLESTPLPHVLSILQSGEYLTVSIGQLQGDGRVINAMVSAPLLRPVRDLPRASDSPSSYLDAHVEAPPGNGLTGTIAMRRSDCPAVAFRASRLP